MGATGKWAATGLCSDRMGGIRFNWKARAATAAVALASVCVVQPAPSANGASTPIPVFKVIQAEQATLRTLQVAARSLLGVKTTTVAVIDSDWSILRNQPYGLAIGNAKRGWELDPSNRSPVGYTAGWVYGNFQGCAWTSTRNIGGNVIPVRGDCESFNPPLSSFTSRVNCILCHGGTAVRLITPAVEYANYRPGRGLLDFVHRAAAGQCVEWRYISKDGSVVMAKDRRFENNEASWVFLPRTALPAIHDLPRNHQSRCWRSSRSKTSAN